MVVEERRLSPLDNIVRASFGDELWRMGPPEDSSSSEKEIEKWTIPSDVMIDLRVKIVICLIHLQMRTNIRVIQCTVCDLP